MEREEVKFHFTYLLSKSIQNAIPSHNAYTTNHLDFPIKEENTVLKLDKRDVKEIKEYDSLVILCNNKIAIKEYENICDKYYTKYNIIPTDKIVNNFIINDKLSWNEMFLLLEASFKKHYIPTRNILIELDRNINKIINKIEAVNCIRFYINYIIKLASTTQDLNTLKYLITQFGDILLYTEFSENLLNKLKIIINEKTNALSFFPIYNFVKKSKMTDNMLITKLIKDNLEYFKNKDVQYNLCILHEPHIVTYLIHNNIFDINNNIVSIMHNNYINILEYIIDNKLISEITIKHSIRPKLRILELLYNNNIKINCDNLDDILIEYIECPTHTPTIEFFKYLKLLINGFNKELFVKVYNKLKIGHSLDWEKVNGLFRLYKLFEISKDDIDYKYMYHQFIHNNDSHLDYNPFICYKNYAEFMNYLSNNRIDIDQFLYDRTVYEFGYDNNIVLYLEENYKMKPTYFTMMIYAKKISIYGNNFLSAHALEAYINKYFTNPEKHWSGEFKQYYMNNPYLDKTSVENKIVVPKINKSAKKNNKNTKKNTNSSKLDDFSSFDQELDNLVGNTKKSKKSNELSSFDDELNKLLSNLE
jgi:hypothetical protein